MKLAELQQGQVVTVRHGRDAGGDSIEPSWGPWHTAEIVYLVRRDVPLPAKLQWRSSSPNLGDIVTLAIAGWPCEYSQGDYCGKGQFVAEDWYLEIQGLE